MLFRPLTPDRWDDFEALFGARGAYAGCWCMWWRLKRREFEAQQGDGNRAAMKAIVAAGRIPGILGYDGERPVAWCSVAPRDEFPSLNRSPVLKAIDERPVWSIVCFFVARSHRRQGVIEKLIRAAVRHAGAGGATIVEAYPSVPRSGNVPPTSSYMGFPDVFERAGFREVAAPSASKRIVRRTVPRKKR
jgi:GNAT superfamily N-acetyltransferase